MYSQYDNLSCLFERIVLQGLKCVFSLRDLESLGIPASELHMVADGMGSVSPDGLMTARPYQSGVQQVLEVLSKRASMDTG